MNAAAASTADARAQALLQAAIARGLLPATARLPEPTGRPWPVVLLTALGAWLAAVPLMAVAALLLGDLLMRDGGGVHVIGALLLAGAVVVLRSPALPLFVEQLAVPVFVAGGGLVSYGLFRDLPTSAAGALLCALWLLVALPLRAAWMRVLLGAAASAMLVVAVMPELRHAEAAWSAGPSWVALHVALAAWLGLVLLQRQWPGGPVLAGAWGALEAVSAGWLLATLAALAWWSGITFVVGASLGSGGAGAGGWPWHRGAGAAHAALSAVLAIAGAAWAARRWPALRHPSLAAAGLVLATLAWFMPALGGVLMALAVCATASRWRLAAAAGVAAAWIVGAFYYALVWPLTTKAAVLAVAGAALGALAWWSAPRATAAGGAQADAAPEPAPLLRRARLLIACSAVAVLGVANVGIWQKEYLIAHGTPVYIELAPVDPRSLMQGDYMRLAFRMPQGGDELPAVGEAAERPRLLARRDARGVAKLLRPYTGGALAADELLLELAPRDGRWVVVTDAWFFAEGEADRWAGARYGEFRVDARGRALLVGLRGAALEDLGRPR